MKSNWPHLLQCCRLWSGHLKTLVLWQLFSWINLFNLMCLVLISVVTIRHVYKILSRGEIIWTSLIYLSRLFITHALLYFLVSNDHIKKKKWPDELVFDERERTSKRGCLHDLNPTHISSTRSDCSINPWGDLNTYNQHIPVWHLENLWT